MQIQIKSRHSEPHKFFFLLRCREIRAIRRFRSIGSTRIRNDAELRGFDAIGADGFRPEIFLLRFRRRNQIFKIKEKILKIEIKKNFFTEKRLFR